MLSWPRPGLPANEPRSSPRSRSRTTLKSATTSGFRQDAISGQNISLTRAVYYRRLTPRSYVPLDFPLYIGASLERGRAWNNDNDFDSGYINAASIFLGFDTPLGPLNFSYGFNDDDQQAIYLNLGQTF